MPEKYPILYSLQHCPYAMRARLGILSANLPVLLRAIVLKNKPSEMLKASSKGTVPVLVVDETTVIDESLDIMLWALSKNDPNNLLNAQVENALSNMLSLINRYDTEFKTALERYKCAKRYHDANVVEHRENCEHFIHELEERLSAHRFIMGDTLSLVDFAVFPFIRQFARIDKKRFLESRLPKVQFWLRARLDSKIYSEAMKQYPLWLDSREDCWFGYNA